jgi:hypothetical protein
LISLKYSRDPAEELRELLYIETFVRSLILFIVSNEERWKKDAPKRMKRNNIFSSIMKRKEILRIVDHGRIPSIIREKEYF